VLAEFVPEEAAALVPVAVVQGNKPGDNTSAVVPVGNYINFVVDMHNMALSVVHIERGFEPPSEERPFPERRLLGYVYLFLQHYNSAAVVIVVVPYTD
jgi:hypothetical protein